MKSTSSNFDINKFNAEFERRKEEQTAKYRILDEARLAKLNVAPPPKKIYELSVGEIIIGVKDTWFNLLDDLLQKRFTLDTFTKNNRLFFIGLTVIVIVIIIYLYDMLTTDEPPKNNIKEIHHIYHLASDKEESLDSEKDREEYWKQVARNVVALPSSGVTAGLDDSD